MPVEDKSKYDGEKARVYSIALIAEIKSGKYSRNKPPVNQGEGKDMAAQKGDGKIEEQQAVPASAGDLEDIDDGMKDSTSPTSLHTLTTCRRRWG